MFLPSLIISVEPIVYHYLVLYIKHHSWFSQSCTFHESWNRPRSILELQTIKNNSNNNDDINMVLMKTKSFVRILMSLNLLSMSLLIRKHNFMEDNINIKMVQETHKDPQNEIHKPMV